MDLCGGSRTHIFASHISGRARSNRLSYTQPRRLTAMIKQKRLTWAHPRSTTVLQNYTLMALLFQGHNSLAVLHGVYAVAGDSISLPKTGHQPPAHCGENYTAPFTFLLHGLSLRFVFQSSVR